MVLETCRIGDGEDGQCPWATGPTQDGKRCLAGKDGPKHVRRPRRECVALDDGAQAGEVDEHGLTVATVRPVSRVLGHVGIDAEVVRIGSGEPEHFVGPECTERRPAPWSARDVSMDGSGHVLDHRSALQTGDLCHRGDQSAPMYASSLNRPESRPASSTPAVTRTGVTRSIAHSIA